MNALSVDKNFHYEALRSLGLIRYGCGDVGEQLAIFPNIKPNDPESWYQEWKALAQRVLDSITDTQSLTGKPSSVTLRDAYFKVSHYTFEADFFLHNNWEDPRLYDNWSLWRQYFDKANALLPNPGEHYTVQTPHGFSVPIIVYRAPLTSGPRPTLLIGGGFDSNMEETLHVHGFAALERGYNAILYEGPGQPSLLAKQKKGFIFDWEKVVTPIIDFVEDRQKQGKFDFIDAKKIGLSGMSLGGYLAARAAAFEPRLAAVVLNDGVWDFSMCVKQMCPEAVAAFERGDKQACNELFEKDYNVDTGKRWFHDHAKFSMQVKTGWEVLELCSKMTLGGGLAEKIKMPAWVGDAEADIFFEGQPEKVKDAIGKDAILIKFGSKHAAQNHCQSGALVYQQQKIFDWFGEVVGDKQ